MKIVACMLVTVSVMICLLVPSIAAVTLWHGLVYAAGKVWGFIEKGFDRICP